MRKTLTYGRDKEMAEYERLAYHLSFQVFYIELSTVPGNAGPVSMPTDCCANPYRRARIGRSPPSGS